MKNRLFALLLLSLKLTIAVTSALADDSIEIMSPPDKVWLDADLINLVYRVKNDSFDTVIVVSDYDSAQVHSGPVAKFGTHHNSLFLREGKNRIAVQGLKGKKVIAEKSITVLLRSDLLVKHDTVPPGFKRYIFHTLYHEKNCLLCHESELSEGSRSQRNEALPACYTCHKRIIEYEYVHGPASVWACAACHSEKSEVIKYQVPDPEGMVCRMCHAEQLTAWESEKFGHGPTMAGKCAICHNPHASGEKFFLKMSTSDLCGYCHQDKLKNPHMVAEIFNKGHPVKPIGGKNGRRDISCASCHNPHAANNVYLVKRFKESKMDLCPHCHLVSSQK